MLDRSSLQLASNIAEPTMHSEAAKMPESSANRSHPAKDAGLGLGSGAWMPPTSSPALAAFLPPEDEPETSLRQAASTAVPTAHAEPIKVGDTSTVDRSSAFSFCRMTGSSSDRYLRRLLKRMCVVTGYPMHGGCCTCPKRTAKESISASAAMMLTCGLWQWRLTRRCSTRADPWLRSDAARDSPASC